MNNKDDFFMNIAEICRNQSKCIRRSVGSVLVREDHLVASGYNGTPSGYRNCTEGGCDRCFNSKRYQKGRDYDLCLCVHGEQNCILQAAKYGHAVQGCSLYTTLQPCLTCLKEIISVGIVEVVYRESWIVPLEQWEAYSLLCRRIAFRQYKEVEEEKIHTKHSVSTFAP